MVPFDGAQDVLEHVKLAYEHNTVPMVFSSKAKNIQFVGGYTDLVEYLDE